MGKKTTKTVKLPESKAEEWDTYAEENEAVDSISHLIRLSVERQMQGKYNQPEAPSGNSDAAESGEVLTVLRKIQTGVEDLEERLDAIEEVNEAEANFDLQKAIWELLPEEPNAVVDNEIPLPEKPENTSAITAEELAGKLGAEQTVVRDTLDELVESTGQVQRSDVNHNGRHYWRKSR